MRRTEDLIAACVVATAAFIAYSRTLLPGVDLGDTGGFQAAVLWNDVSARQAYPLYYALAKPFVAVLSPANPALGLNLFSAVWAAIAVGVLAWFVAQLTRSARAGAAAGLLFATSYTFWSQAVIAEVYSLHLALIGVCLVLLHRYSEHRTRPRLLAFFCVYALSFGNHLSMILLFLPFSMFLLSVQSRPRDLLTRNVLAWAVLIAAAGALLYLPNVLSVVWSPEPLGGWHERLRAFWFDTTKADWRGTMVFGIGADRGVDRVAMWGWDARQQFGLAGLVLATMGAVRLWALSRPWAVLAWTSFVITTAFALTYNVGDSHVFFLPSHFFTALAAGVAVAPLSPATSNPRSPIPGVLAAAVIAYGGWRAWDTWPALDRHLDRRASTLVAQLTFGVSEQNAVLVSEMDWQAENALLYSSRYQRSDLAWTRLADVVTHFPFFVGDNQHIGRDVVLVGSAAASVESAFTGVYPLVPDRRVPFVPATERVARLAPGTPYVLCLLTPQREEHFDARAFEALLAALTGDRPPTRDPGAAYEVWAGVSGDRPVLYRGAPRPFRERVSILGDAFDIRMDSWLPHDTFRRPGFGHVIRGRQPVLTVERGVSLVWFDRGDAPLQLYEAGLYALHPRFRIPAGGILEIASQ